MTAEASAEEVRLVWNFERNGYQFYYWLAFVIRVLSVEKNNLLSAFLGISLRVTWPFEMPYFPKHKYENCFLFSSLLSFSFRIV